jgi:hypothetical protein
MNGDRCAFPAPNSMKSRVSRNREKALDLQKAGHSLLIVSERDYHALK